MSQTSSAVNTAASSTSSECLNEAKFNAVVAKYDLIAIGAGPAGEKRAAQTACFGKRVCIIDPRPRPGGIAVSTAGILTKTVREGVVYLCGLGQSGLAGSHPQGPWPLLMARKIEVSELMTAAVERNLVRHGIDRIRARARLDSPGRVQVDKGEGQPLLLEADVVLLAFGSRPRHPPEIPINYPDVEDAENGKPSRAHPSPT
jgi:NAD(P) transhydrogenase